METGVDHVQDPLGTMTVSSLVAALSIADCTAACVQDAALMTVACEHVAMKSKMAGLANHGMRLILTSFVGFQNPLLSCRSSILRCCPPQPAPTQTQQAPCH